MEKYTKLKNIGKGNMGSCFLMRHNEDGKLYVMKQIDLGSMAKRERKQALNEARVLSSLRHPNIINYVDSFLARRSDHLCIVMEYAEAGDIAGRLKSCRGHLRENIILDWFIQTCLAINAIHQKHILHRDIKTQNIFLTSSGIIKVGDFGIARELNNTFDQAHTFVGTPYYLSPELVQEKPYDARSDTWALGVVLYEMMALKHPFNAADMKSLMTKIIRVNYDPPPSYYSHELRDIVQKVLVKDPRNRLSLAAILGLPIVRKRLGQWVNGQAGVPHVYLEQMLKHKLLPAYARIGEAPSLPSDVNTQAERPNTESRLLEENYRRQLEAEIEQEKQSRRDNIKREFADVKLGPRGGGGNGANSQLTQLANAPPIPSAPHRDAGNANANVQQHQHANPLRGNARETKDPFVAQNEALRRNLAPSPFIPSPTSKRQEPDSVRQSDVPDSLRARELMKERELQGMMGQRELQGMMGQIRNHPHLIRIPKAINTPSPQPFLGPDRHHPSLPPAPNPQPMLGHGHHGHDGLSRLGGGNAPRPAMLPPRLPGDKMNLKPAQNIPNIPSIPSYPMPGIQQKRPALPQLPNPHSHMVR
eukprot:TRINITY_DN3471_c0_g1_i1.p1 TRINITY_DN3471_c0_g1~~TRINITY_DN3471_c0_g1_i1.p1  ORF type:complete len:589 (+),score=214.98 TRINITY_DN3471_c0_g1_i1:212-1978(+)